MIFNHFGGKSWTKTEEINCRKYVFLCIGNIQTWIKQFVSATLPNLSQQLTLCKEKKTLILTLLSKFNHETRSQRSIYSMCDPVFKY